MGAGLDAQVPASSPRQMERGRTDTPLRLDFSY